MAIRSAVSSDGAASEIRVRLGELGESDLRECNRNLEAYHWLVKCLLDAFNDRFFRRTDTAETEHATN